MTIATPEQINAIHVTTDACMAASKIAFTGLGRLAALNLGAARAALDESFASAGSMLEAKDFTELRRLQAALSKPAGERTAAYVRNLREIAEDTQGEMTKLMGTHGWNRGAGSGAAEAWAKGFDMYKQAVERFTAMAAAQYQDPGEPGHRALSDSSVERHGA